MISLWVRVADGLAVTAFFVLVDGRPTDLALAEMAGAREVGVDEFGDGADQGLAGAQAAELGAFGFQERTQRALEGLEELGAEGVPGVLDALAHDCLAPFFNDFRGFALGKSAPFLGSPLSWCAWPMASSSASRSRMPSEFLCS
jgi:hypothetical protein